MSENEVIHMGVNGCILGCFYSVMTSHICNFDDPKIVCDSFTFDATLNTFFFFKFSPLF